MTALLVLGTGAGPVGLLGEALGDRLRDQLRRHRTGFLALAGVERSGGDVAAALCDELAVVRAISGRCESVVVTAEAPGLRGVAGVAAGAVELLRAALGKEVNLRLVVERQDRLAEYDLLEAVRTGREQAWSPGPDLGAEAAALTALPGVATLTARPYELVGSGIATWVDGVLGGVGLRGSLDLRPLVHGDPLRVHRTTTRTGLAVGRALAAELSDEGDLAALHDFLVTSFAAGADDRLLSAAERAELVAAHRDANAAFFAGYAPDLPPRSYDDDAATALLARIPVTVRVPPPAPHVVLRRRAGSLRRAVLHRVRAGD